LVWPKADQDIEEHAAYLGEVAGLDLGHRFLLAADETFLLLSRNPGIGWPPRIRSVQLQGLRIEKILVFYKPVDQGIEILRVVHGSRDLLQFFHRQRIE
jgi:toxin ParE1/3/4